VLQFAAVCCSVLQCAALCCSVLQCAAVCCRVLQGVVGRSSALQCIAVRCIASQCIVGTFFFIKSILEDPWPWVFAREQSLDACTHELQIHMTPRS